MARAIFAILAALLTAGSSQAALLVSYGFDGGTLSPTFVNTPVTATAISGTYVSSSPAQPYLTLSQTNSLNYVPYATFTVNKGVVESLSFDGSALGQGYVKISNSVNSQIAEGFVWNQTPTNFSVSFTTPFTADNTVFTISMRSNNGGNVVGRLDNISVSGVVPEPASVAVFGLVGTGMLLVRRRNRRS